MYSKEQIIAKWSPVIEQLGVDKKNNRNFFNLMCEYADYSASQSAKFYTSTSVSNGISNVSSLYTPSHNEDINNQKLVIELNILSKINLTNKVIIIKDLNDNKKLRFNITPEEKFLFSVEKIQNDIKMSRSDKLHEINSISEGTERIDHLERLIKIIKNIIIFDINERLLEGNILYIDGCLIDNVSELSTPYKQIVEFVTKYDII
jgi:predicted oxidoreductase